MTAPVRGFAPSGVLFGGAAVVLAASVAGFLHAFSMTDGPGMAGHPMPLMGMPLSEMPEMWFAAAGLALAVTGAVLRARPREAAPARPRTASRAVQAVIGTTALTIDVSKTSTLGFVIPGMRTEYGLGASTASLLAVAGLTGTAVGAVLFGLFADRLGRRCTYLIAMLGFSATSMCGCMPTFGGNVVMCGLMGVAVGGLAPLLITMLTETFTGRSRGAVVTGLSVVATAVGYLVAAGSALWLEPLFGWRVLWLIGAPTGLLLALCTPWVPERPSRTATVAPPEAPRQPRQVLSGGVQRLYAVLIGLVTFGLTTWVPSLARAGGLSTPAANLALTVSALVMVPCSVVLMLAYRRLGPASLAAGLAVGTAAVLLGLVLSGALSAAWVCAAALVAALFAVNSMTAIFLPITADLADATGRARATGGVSLCHRLGGLCGPLVMANLVSSAASVLVAVAVFALGCAGVAGVIGHRGRVLARSTPAVARARTRSPAQGT
jgi:predicted MFS family arabinose efflux permease